MMVTKESLLKEITSDKTQAAVGRVVDWLESDKDKRYPQSCTVLAVKDSVEGEEGIDYADLYLSKGLRFAQGVALDYSQLRPAGTQNGEGLTASGPVSFMKFASIKNEVLRRGGVFKSGAVVVYLDANHPDIIEFLELSTSELPWAKKALYISDDPNSEDYILSSKFTDISIPEKEIVTEKLEIVGQSENGNPLYEKVTEVTVRPAMSLLEYILYYVRNGTLWLAKKRWDSKGERLYSQVCTEILLKSRATCVLHHINLGQITNFKQLVPAFEKGMQILCDLHTITKAGIDNYYLPVEEDKQVGLGVIGLANLLANNNITYADFTKVLTVYFNHYDEFNHISNIPLRHQATFNYLKDFLTENSTPKLKVLNLVHELAKAFYIAGEYAKLKGMERAFTIAPTASCSYRYTDIKGFTTAAEISPPIAHRETKRVTRDSSTFGAIEYQYPLNVETAAEVGYEGYFNLCCAWQRLMESTGLAHAISHNVWNSCPVDRKWFEEWLKSPLVTTYYRMLEEQDFVDKSGINAGLSEENQFDEEDDFFMPVADEEAVTCSIDKQYCEACGG